MEIEFGQIRRSNLMYRIQNSNELARDYLCVTVDIKSKEKCEVDECDGHDNEAGNDPFEAVAEIFLLEEGDWIRPSNHIRRYFWMLWPMITK